MARGLSFALAASKLHSIVAKCHHAAIVRGKATRYFGPMKELFQHAAVTNGVTVRVAVNFLPEQSRIEAGKWFWVYHIRLENHGNQAVQLLTRHWRITDGRGMVNLIEGDGVVGEQPLLQPGQSHDYVSGCPLSTPHGSMEGFYTFRMVGGGVGDGELFEAAIPFFPLAAPATAG
jgi:ApaG protein